MKLTYYDGEKPIKTSGGGISLKATGFGNGLYEDEALDSLMNLMKKDIASNLEIINNVLKGDKIK